MGTSKKSVVLDQKDRNESITHKIDNVVIHRFAANPIFLTAMFVTFWFAIGFGSVFIDFFDIIGGLVFVDVPAALLASVGSPAWILVMVGGIGAGCQTVATFVPVVFFMFLSLAILESLGYIASTDIS